MNISTNPWIPVVQQGGNSCLVSLSDVFSQGSRIYDLAVQPHERIALMRLLICIAQASLDGPANYDDWQTCKDRIQHSAKVYLKKWQKVFELFGDGQRFLQLQGLSDSGQKLPSTSKLDIALATGANPTLFDNNGGSFREFTPQHLTLNLLTFQCFSPGGRIGVAKWARTPTLGNGASKDAPCIANNMLHALIREDNLIATIHSNLLNKKQVSKFFGPKRWGCPVWERMPKRLTDVSAVGNATKTYLGRLVPISRAIRLFEDGKNMILANGLDYEPYPQWREPTSTIFIKEEAGKQDRFVLPSNLEKAIWRELHAVTVIAKVNQIGGPAALQNISDRAAFDLWAGGLAKMQAKLEDKVESVFHLPVAMLRTNEVRKIYEEGVQWAEKKAASLGSAVLTYHRELGDDTNRPEARERRKQLRRRVLEHFWTDVDQHVSYLLEVVEHPEILTSTHQWHRTKWGGSVHSSALNAYRTVCSLDTPRKMRAYARGLKKLSDIANWASIPQTV